MALPLRRGMIALVATMLSTVVLTSCGSSDGSGAAGTRYVALGDSAVAGAGIGLTSAPCHRSKRNYPSLLAGELPVDQFVDASCIGATTHDVLDAHTADDGEIVPPQIEDVTPDTDVVTISIGGNDSQFIPSLFVSCYIPPTNSAKACQSAVDRLPALLAKTQKSIVTVLEAIHKKAPDALVVMVSYLRIMPDSGKCDPQTVPITPTYIREAAAAEGKLEAVMRAATEQAGATYVNMRKVSVGHDACSGEGNAWVSGNDPIAGDGTFLHPRAKGAEAVARAVDPVIRSRLRKQG
jgi:lysophospholipase L1-like esterase